MDTLGIAVIVAVVAARFLVPFAILRYPLPGILAAFAIDHVDQSILLAAGVDMAHFNYQEYDKALDIHYLVFAMFAAMRNWRPTLIIALAAALLYFRLAGVALFEMTGWRPLLMIFPNTFEYFFIYIALVETRRPIELLSRAHLITATVVIWVFVKLPQELWLHILQLSSTDEVKIHLFGVSLQESWWQALANRPLAAAFPLALLSALILAAVWIGQGKHPGHAQLFRREQLPEVSAFWARNSRPWHYQLIERYLLILLASVIFAHGFDAGVPTENLIIAIASIVVPNALLVSAFAIGRSTPRLPLRFALHLALNCAILAGFWLQPVTLPAMPAAFLVMLTLMITLFEAFRAPRPQLSELLREIGGPEPEAGRAIRTA